MEVSKTDRTLYPVGHFHFQETNTERFGVRKDCGTCDEITSVLVLLCTQYQASVRLLA